MTTFEEISTQILAYFNEKEYEAGLVYATNALETFPEQIPTVNYWRMCFAAQLENQSLANEIFDKTLASGIWYSELLLRQSPSLQILQGEDGFERLVEISLKMRAVDPTDSHRIIILRHQEVCRDEEDGEGCPAIIFLHGNQDNVQNNLPHWSALSNSGWLVAMPQSSRALWVGNYAWTDYATAAEEVAHHFKSLTANYNINPKRLIIAGVSMGAEIALALALSGEIPAVGFLLIGPAGPFMDEIENWEPFIEQAQERQLRGYVFTGEKDTTIPHANINNLITRLNNKGIPTQQDIWGNLGHEYPELFAESLETALAYILN